MPIGAGVRLGPYEILTPLGAGGMGEVYRAKDTRLDRTVAIKVLPAHMADNPEQRQRLDREAHAIAGLTHPHICTLHDIGHQDGVDYLVMEYLDGETLAARLPKGALPLDQVFTYATQIADALDKAHRAGIVHRDLKPGNVMLTKGGAKLLDFGLAKSTPGLKAWPTPLSGPEATSLPTSPASLTAKGMILGTLQYMAPEQLEGKEADERTDIFALGAVIYEMATGKKAFRGDSQASLIAAILTTTPPGISELQPLTPPALDHVVTTCLAKDPDERWQSARDVERQLKWIASTDSSVDAHPRLVHETKWKRLTIIALGLMAAISVIGSVFWIRDRSSRRIPGHVTRSTISLPASNSIPIINSSEIAISPDGTRLLYQADDGKRLQLYLRALDQLTANPIPGTENAGDAFFSPDGEWVGFFAADSTLKKVPLSGGTPTTICRVMRPKGAASWGPDDTIVFNTSIGLGLSRVSAAGGIPQVLTTPDRARREKTHRFPEVLPGGKAVLFTAPTADIASYDDARIEVLSLETGARRVLIEGGTQARYAPTGHIIYARAGALFAVPFDLDRLDVTGTPVQVLAGVATVPNDGFAHFAISQAGSLVYLSGGASTFDNSLLWVDRQGKRQPINARDQQNFGALSLSPEGRRIAVQIRKANDEIWIYDVARDAFSRLAFGWNNQAPVWTRDGARVAFSSDRAGVVNLFWQPADGSGPAERLTTSAHEQFPYSWSPDGKVLAFTDDSPGTHSDIWTLLIDGDRKPKPFLHEPFSEQWPAFSPDGRWLAYVSDETGRNEIYVRPYPAPGGKWQVSTDGGWSPVWARNGRELFWEDWGLNLMGASVTPGATFNATRPRVVVHLAGLGAFDISPDAQRFVVESYQPPPQATQINLVLNWFEELKRKVAATH